MDGGCAMTQNSAACGLTVGDADNLNVEHELSRWLHELDNSMSTTTASPRKPAPPKVAAKHRTSPAVTSPQQQPPVSRQDTEADFEAILGQLNSLDQLFDSVAKVDHSGNTGPPPPPPPADQQTAGPATTAFDGCDDVLRGALLELSAIAGSDGVVDTPPPVTSPRQNGHGVDQQQRHLDGGGTTDDTATSTVSSSSSSSLSTVASDKSSTRNGCSSPASVPLSPTLNIKPAQTPVQVFLPDGASSHVMVDEHTSTEQLCRLMMRRRNVPLMTSWSILEHLPDMFMERRIERHESVLDVVRNWVKGTTNKLVFVENVGRYALYDTDHQGLLVDSVYDVKGPLHVKAEDKKTWRKLDCELQTSGLCCRATPAGGGTGKQGRQAEMTFVQSLHDVDVYLAVDWRKKYKSPTEHGIALKPAYVQKKTPKCVKYLCCDDEASLVRWMTALRLAKYGEQLTSVSRGPEVSHDQTVTTSSTPLSDSTAIAAAAAAIICSPGIDVDELTATSTIRRKGSLVPALPITTQTTRLISQQSRSGKDDPDGSHHHVVPAPPAAVDPRIPAPTDNGASRTASRAAPGGVSGLRLPAAAASTAPASTSPRDLPSPPTSANTTVVDPSNFPFDNRSANRAPPAAAQRPPATSSHHGTPTRSASARVAEGSGGHGSPARPKPAPPKRSETTKLSTADPRQTKAFILNLDRVIKLKNCKGSTGLATLPVPLPPRPVYVEGPTYLDTDDLPPPPAELLEGLRSMRRQGMPLPPIPAPGRR